MSTVRKHSHKRDAILECLRCTTSHPTADWVYTQLKPTIPDLSLATVYRTIESVGVYDGLERFDFRTDPHAHFICRVCGAVSDINWLELPEDTLSEVERQTGSKVESCRIAVTGVCAGCVKKDAH